MNTRESDQDEAWYENDVLPIRIFRYCLLATALVFVAGGFFYPEGEPAKGWLFAGLAFFMAMAHWYVFNIEERMKERRRMK